MDMKRPLLAAALALAAASAGATVLPKKMNFQGKLVDPATNNPKTGTFSMTFALYKVPTAGTAIYTETQPSVTVTNGVFSVQIGTLTALDETLFTDASTYLGVTVSPDAEMTPRTQMVMSPYAFTAGQLSQDSDILISPGAASSTFTATGDLTMGGGIIVSSGSFRNGITASSGTFTGGALSVGGSSFTVTGGSATVAYGLTASSVTLTTQGSNVGYGLTVSSGVQINAGTLDVNAAGGITNSYGLVTSTLSFSLLTTDPVSAPAGTFYFNTSSGTLKMFNGASWRWMYAPTVQSTAYSASSAGATAARATGLILVTPFSLPGPMVVNKLTINVTTLLGATGDYGVYNSTGGLVLNVGSGNLTTAVGVKSLAPIQTGVGRFLPPGQYYAAATWNNAAGVIGGVPMPLGLVPLSGTAAGGGTVLPNTISLTAITNTAFLYFIGLSQ